MTNLKKTTKVRKSAVLDNDQLENEIINESNDVNKDIVSSDAITDNTTEEVVTNSDSKRIKLEHETESDDIEPVQPVDQDDLNQPLKKLNEQLNLYMPPLKDSHDNSLVIVKKTKAKNGDKYFVNVNYRGRAQSFLIGSGQKVMNFALMTPFMRTRYPDPLPFGSHKSGFNDPESKIFNNYKFGKPKLSAAVMGFELTNEPFLDNNNTYDEAEKFFEHLDQAQELLLLDLCSKLESIFPSVYKQTVDRLKILMQEPTPINIKNALPVKRLVFNDKNNILIKFMRFSHKLFRNATDQEKAMLESDSFQSKSGNAEITNYLKKTLTMLPNPEDDESTPVPKVDNELKLWRCLHDSGLFFFVDNEQCMFE